jgi:uncharacterized membrane protein
MSGMGIMATNGHDEPDPIGSQTDSGNSPHLAALQAARAELDRLEGLLQTERRSFSEQTRAIASHVAATARRVPAWLRVTRGESRWPAAAAMLIAIGLQLSLPNRLTLQSRWLLPGVELVLLAVLIVANPGRLNKESRILRGASLTLSGLLSLANAWSAALLVLSLVHGGAGTSAQALLSNGAAIWLTNVIAFGLWYWQFDRGGPAARAHARRTQPDFQFVQMQDPHQRHLDWEPGFVDYLYLSFTNAMAFSPTDVMPLSRWAKLTMLFQSLVSLVTVALVIARAVNILG